MKLDGGFEDINKQGKFMQPGMGLDDQQIPDMNAGYATHMQMLND